MRLLKSNIPFPPVPPELRTDPALKPVADYLDRLLQIMQINVQKVQAVDESLYVNEDVTNLARGDVVAAFPVKIAAVADVALSGLAYLVALTEPPIGSGGYFHSHGVVEALCTGVVTGGHFLKKSTVPRALEDTGTTIGVAAPSKSVAIALASQGAVTALLPVFFWSLSV